MQKDDLVYVGHMLDVVGQALALVKSKGREAYDADETLRLSLTHLIQVVGEAAGRVSEDFRSAHPDIPWSDIIGMRHRIVHDYLDVDERIVWKTATEDLPPLMEMLSRIVPP